MRSLSLALVALFAFSLPLAARAGDGCPYSKQKATTASSDAPATHAEHHAGSCDASCPHAAAAVSSGHGGCACTGGGTTAQAPDQSEASTASDLSSDPSSTVAAND